MLRNVLRRLRWPLLGVTAAALALTIPSALAGSGVGATFTLGQTNTVNATSTLTGATAGPQLTIANPSMNSSATGLNVSVKPGRPPFTLNSPVKVQNLNADLLDGLHSSAFWRLGGNNLSSAGILGTTSNQSLELRVNGKRALRLEPRASAPNLVGGSSANAVLDGASGATIGGGGKGLSSQNGNLVSDDFGTVGGGGGNVAGDRDSGHNPVTARLATVGGGDRNVASGQESTVAGGSINLAGGEFASVAGGSANVADAPWATVGGGESNDANPLDPSATAPTIAGGLENRAMGSLDSIGGGSSNQAQGDHATIAGGGANEVNGSFGTVAGGELNAADGSLSFAAGYRAKATDFGSFVWGDSNGFDVNSNGTNSFTVRAVGGARFISGIDFSTGAPTQGVVLAPFAGSWSDLSDRSAKERFTPIDRQRLLDRLDRIPIERWSYKGQAAGIRHLGPTAQDFRAAFGLGEDARHIDTIDSEGIALAAIQGLYRQNQVLRHQNRSLNGKVNGLQRQNRALGARLAKLEKAVAKLSR